MTTFECELCSSKIKIDSLSPNYLVVNFCKNCKIQMEPVKGRKPIRITIDGITSDPTKPTWKQFVLYWNYTNNKDVQVELANFDSFEDRDIYLNFLKCIGIPIN